MQPHVGLLVVDLHIPDAVTLKDKRQVVRSLLDRAASRFNVSVAEIDHLDTCQRALLAFACVANEPRHVHRVLAGVCRSVESEARAEVLDATLEVAVL